MNYRQIIGVIFILHITITSFGQATWKTWDALELTLSQNKKFDHKIGYLKCLNMSDSFHNDFNQLYYQADYDINKKFSVRGSFMLTSFPASSTQTLRGIGRISHRLNLNKKIIWTNSLQFEYHSVEETRYRERIIYVTKIGLKKRLKFLKLSPSISYWLYYNIGGNTIKYYDPSGATFTRNTPNGFHRGRLFVNVNTKINRNFSLSLYYMNQNEFNFLTPNNRKINVINPNTGKIYRAFDTYNVVGLSALFDINLYK